MRLPLALTLLLAATGAACAGASPWQEIAPGVKARLISDDVLTGGTTRGGFEIDLPEGYKTYWRIAGETGIPTELDMTGATGLASPRIDWPFPDIDTADGLRNYVYHGNLVLPFTVSVTGPDPVLDVAALLGVCSDICVPASARFTLPLALGAADKVQGLRLDLAARQAPEKWPEISGPIAMVNETETGLDLSGVDDRLIPESLIVDMDDPALLFGAPQKSPVANLWHLPLLGHKGQAAWNGRSVNLTFMTAMGPYAASFVVGQSN